MAEENQTPKDNFSEENIPQNKAPDGKIPDDIKLHSPFLKSLENFWYHYKWHTIISLFLVFFILISTLQMCSRPTFDCHVAYAGNAGSNILTGTALTDMQNSLLSVMEDYNGDGEKQVSIARYWMDTTENIQEVGGNTGTLINTSNENRETLKKEILAGETYLCFLSPAEFEWMADYRENNTTLLYSIKDICPDIPRESLYVYENERVSVYGVRLSALPFGELPGFESLPKDTVICLRNLVGLGGLFSKDKQISTHEHHKALLKAILTYVPEEETAP